MKKKKFKRMLCSIISMLVFILAGALLVGCGTAPVETEQTAGPAARERPAREKAVQEEEKEEEVAETYRYVPTGKRDPFVIPEAPERACTPATCYDLEQMYIDAIIWGSGMEAAHIILPTGEDIIVKEGDELGINHGRVKDISNRQVVVEEIYVDPLKPSDIHIIEKIMRMEKEG